MSECEHDVVDGVYYPESEFITLKCERCGKSFSAFKGINPRPKMKYDKKILESLK